MCNYKKRISSKFYIYPGNFISLTTLSTSTLLIFQVEGFKAFHPLTIDTMQLYVARWSGESAELNI